MKQVQNRRSEHANCGDLSVKKTPFENTVTEEMCTLKGVAPSLASGPAPILSESLWEPRLDPQDMTREDTVIK